MVCHECARLLEHRYTLNTSGREQVSSGVYFTRSVDQIREYAFAEGPKFCAICQSLARHFPPAGSQEDGELWKKIGTFGTGDKEMAYYSTSLAEIKSPNLPGRNGETVNSLQIFVLSLGLNRVGSRVFKSPMQSIKSQRLVSDYLLVASSRADRHILPPRGANERSKLRNSQGGNTTGSVEALDMAKFWLKQCLEHHVQCKTMSHPQSDSSPPKPKDFEEFAPKRLVQILPIGLRLQITRGMVGEISTSDSCRPYQYATLSHRWPSDSDQISQLTTSNIELWQREIDQGPGFSQSFKDAIVVCRHLDIEYIWIDSLCIIQQGDGGQDWQEEAGNMGSIYKWGVCNIAATSVVDGDEGITRGFFRSRDLSETQPDIISARCNLEDLPREGDGLMTRIRSKIPGKNRTMVDYHIIPSQQITHDVVNATLNQRGWVVQERHLSSRIIHFTKKQIYWECNEGLCSETYTKRDPVDYYHRPSKNKRVLSQLVRYQHGNNTLPLQVSVAAVHSLAAKDPLWSLYNLWYDIVAIYSSCSLTRRTDKLIAISGIARELRTRLNVSDADYVAGLWRQNLLYGLLWQTPVITTPNHRTLRRHNTNDEAHHAPTWSWASLDCEVSINHRLFHDPHDRLATVTEVNVTPKVDPYSEVNPGANLKIRGTVYKVKLRYSCVGARVWPELMIGTHIDGHCISTKARGTFAVLPDEPPSLAENTKSVGDRDVYMLPIIKSSKNDVIAGRQTSRNKRWLVALLLVPVDINDAYKRLGIVELRGEGSDGISSLGPISRRICKPESKVVSIF
ncbi:heterokaryon incompatibility protein-domain-containing protein [Xylariaceae sp. FL1651]|nr:heterokaryon incompatibility protein-domain-containing protein [Xylariaceae sp. FL1651]